MPPQRTAADLTVIEWADLIDDLDCAPINEGIEISDRKVADVRGAGSQDVIVSADCVHYNSAWPYQVVVYDGSSRADAPHRLGLLLDDTEGLLADSVTVTGGKITVHTLGFAADDGLCCPSLKGSRRFSWNGSTFVKS